MVRTAVDWIARSPARAFVLIFCLSFVMRLVVLLTLVPPEYVQPHTRWEMEAVATSLAQEGELADPYALPTGPTAHLPPVYPAILGLIYSAFGLTMTAGYVSWLLRIAIYSALYAMLPWVAGKLGLGQQAGVLGGIAGAAIPLWPSYHEPLAAVALALLLIAFVTRWTADRNSWRSSLLLGLAWGAAFHLQPALLPVLLGCLTFELWRWRQRTHRWRGSAILVLGIAVACIPWGWRNYATFDSIFFIRSNFGLELRMGNHEGAAAHMDVMAARGEFLHPRTHLEEARKVQELGEIEYMRQAKHEALAWIETHPAEFLRLTFLRFVHFWAGPLHKPWTALAVSALTLLAVLGAWRAIPAIAVPQRAVLLIPLATFPVVYYIVAHMARYREPVGWLLLVLAGAQVWHWIEQT